MVDKIISNNDLIVPTIQAPDRQQFTFMNKLDDLVAFDHPAGTLAKLLLYGYIHGLTLAAIAKGRYRKAKDAYVDITSNDGSGWDSSGS